MTVRFAAIGLDHRHIYEQVGRLLELGCECAGYWTEGEPQPLRGFVERFPGLVRVDDRRRLLEDPAVEADRHRRPSPASAPASRSRRMRHGKDVMADKPGCITLDELSDARRRVAETGRIWSVTFSERFEVPRRARPASWCGPAPSAGWCRPSASARTASNAPPAARPGSSTRARYGGILTDIGSHQVDQFLFFTGSDTRRGRAQHGRQLRPPRVPGPRGLRRHAAARRQRQRLHPRRLVHARRPADLGRRAPDHPRHRGLHRAAQVRRHRRPRPAPTTCSWSTASSTAVHRLLATSPCPTTADLVHDVINRTETAMPQAHAFLASELALQAEAQARAWATCVEPPPSSFRRGRQNWHRARRGRPAGSLDDRSPEALLRVPSERTGVPQRAGARQRRARPW